MEITVEKDRRGHIRYINQQLTYAGLLEGLPHDKLNARIIARALSEAKTAFHDKAVYLVEPTQEPITYEGTYRLGKPQKLPEVLCMASVRSYEPARDKTADYSELTIVWFQEDFAFPIADTILEQLQQLPWSKLATDCEF